MGKKKAVTNRSSVKPSTSQSKPSTNQEAIHQSCTTLDEMVSSVAELVPFRKRLSEEPKQLTTVPNVSDDPIPLNPRLMVVFFACKVRDVSEELAKINEFFNKRNEELVKQLESPGLDIARLELDRDTLIEKSVDSFSRELEFKRNLRYGESSSLVSET